MVDYRYTECGLDNVTIHGAEVLVDDAGDEVYCIRNVVGLHKVIAQCIITHGHGITPDELRFLRTEMGLTQAELAALVKKDHQTIGRWERGEKTIDQNAEALIRMIAAEKLEVAGDMSAEETAARCIPSAELEIIDIDGSNPEEYKQIAA
jgi:DNA-binding transcriptional regulator YiaG